MSRFCTVCRLLERIVCRKYLREDKPRLSIGTRNAAPGFPRSEHDPPVHGEVNSLAFCREVFRLKGSTQEALEAALRHLLQLDVSVHGPLKWVVEEPGGSRFPQCSPDKIIMLLGSIPKVNFAHKACRAEENQKRVVRVTH